MGDIGWHFPPTGGGREDGYIDPGMEYFSGSPLGSLARETIQNSLDARAAPDKPVSVTFELKEIANEDDLGRAELAQHIEACLKEVEDDPKASGQFVRAARLVAEDNITFLRVADYYTTGLDDVRWEALVKRQGSSEKSSPSAGGSYGIGKYAPFVVSLLRTVFYWSRYEAPGTTLEYCQGKAVLMSHDSADGKTRGKTQGTGFFGDRDGCKQLTAGSIPDSIGSVESNRTASGTSLWIAGFAGERDWRTRVARSVVSNFFCAIADGQLEVLIEPGDAGSMFEHWDIKRGNLAETFEGLLKEQEGDEESDLSRLSEAFAFFTAMRDGIGVVKERQDPDLGHCRLWIHVKDGLPSKVGLIRKTGMLITAEQRSLLRFPGLEDFAAVLRFESDIGNELLRDMENPQHSQFEPDRLLPDKERHRIGQRALNRVVKWVRDEVRTLAAPPVAETSEVVSELAHLLPDLEPDEFFGERNDGETGFGGSDLVTLKPLRRIRNAPLEDDASDEAGSNTELDEGSASPIGERGDGNGGRGEPQGSRGSSGSSGTAGGGRARQAIAVKDVRLLPTNRSSSQPSFHIAFTPTENANNARIELAEAGDSTAMKRTDLKVVTDAGDIPLADHSLDLVAHRRVTLEVRGAEPIERRAWRLQARTWQKYGASGSDNEDAF